LPNLSWWSSGFCISHFHWKPREKATPSRRLSKGRFRIQCPFSMFREQPFEPGGGHGFLGQAKLFCYKNVEARFFFKHTEARLFFQIFGNNLYRPGRDQIIFQHDQNQIIFSSKKWNLQNYLKKTMPPGCSNGRSLSTLLVTALFYIELEDFRWIKVINKKNSDIVDH